MRRSGLVDAGAERRGVSDGEHSALVGAELLCGIGARARSTGRRAARRRAALDALQPLVEHAALRRLAPRRRAGQSRHVHSRCRFESALMVL